MPFAYGLVQPMDLVLPPLPARLEGLRIAHVSDLHVRRYSRRFLRMIRQIAAHRVDLLLLTGDYMEKHHDERPALQVLGDLVHTVRPTLGAYGIFGNHDSPRLIAAALHLPITWLQNQAADHPAAPLRILGLGQEPDAIALIRSMGAGEQRSRIADQGSEMGDQELEPGTPAIPNLKSPSQNPKSKLETEKSLTFLLCHYPDLITTAADLHVDVQFSGHTHGGQLRLPTGHAVINSSSLPLSMTSGILRHRDTLALTSRGVGDRMIPLRLFCPPHVPLYTLRRGPLPGLRTEHIQRIRWW
jgi:predicted MPP superfamily phosphohydrolase